jgi:hypothetical protein
MIYGLSGYHQAERQETDRLGKGGKIWRTGQLRNSQTRYARVRETRVDPLFGGSPRITLGSGRRQRQVAAADCIPPLSTRERQAPCLYLGALCSCASRLFATAKSASTLKRAAIVS